MYSRKDYFIPEHGQKHKRGAAPTKPKLKLKPKGQKVQNRYITNTFE
jgi:hypothetical protein